MSDPDPKAVFYAQIEELLRASDVAFENEFTRLLNEMRDNGTPATVVEMFEDQARVGVDMFRYMISHTLGLSMATSEGKTHH